MPLLGIDASRAARYERTGVEWYSHEIIRAMLSFIPADWNIRLYADRQIQDSRFKIHLLSWPPRFLWSQVRLPIETTLHPPDVLFIPGHVHPFIHPRRTVVVIHDVAFATHPEAYSPHGRAYLMLTTKWAVRTATRIIVPSLAVRDDLARLFHADPTRIRVVPHGPGIVAIPPLNLPPASQRGETTGVSSPFRGGGGVGGGYFIFIGRLETKKNVPRLVRAFLRARQTSAAVRATRLLLVGKPGLLREPILDDPSVVRVGYASRDELTRLLSGARALLFPSLAEGFGLPILDAMTSGVPVLTSIGGATEEVAGGAALLVPPTDEQAIADGIVQLAENDALRHDLSVRGRARAAQFSWETAAQHTWNVIKETVGESLSGA